MLTSKNYWTAYIITFILFWCYRLTPIHHKYSFLDWPFIICFAIIFFLMAAVDRLTADKEHCSSEGEGAEKAAAGIRKRYSMAHPEKLRPMTSPQGKYKDKILAPGAESSQESERLPEHPEPGCYLTRVDPHGCSII